MGHLSTCTAAINCIFNYSAVHSESLCFVLSQKIASSLAFQESLLTE